MRSSSSPWEIGAPAAKIFYGLPVQQTVWMSHGDDIAEMPSCFLPAGESEDGVIAVRATTVRALAVAAAVPSHDFH